MKKNKLNKYFLFSFCVGIFVLTVISINESVLLRDVVEENSNLAQVSESETINYVPLTNGLPEDILDSTNSSLGNLLGLIFRWGIAIAVILSIVMIMLGGLQYMTTDAYSGKTEGKEKVTGAIIGLLLALSSFLILKEIDPNIVDFSSNSFINPQDNL